jgi:hypothetical protein
MRWVAHVSGCWRRSDRAASPRNETELAGGFGRLSKPVGELLSIGPAVAGAGPGKISPVHGPARSNA